jgi:hypothetical protein
VIDLDDNDMIVRGTQPRSEIEQFIATARNGGAWDQPGITSTAAKNHPTGSTTLAVIDGSDYISVHGFTFNGRSIDPTDKVIKYTWYGDADLNGQVNFDDYVRIDFGLNNSLSGWFNGDFDLNGQVNFDDYVLLDLGFNTQSGTLGRSPDTPPSVVPESSVACLTIALFPVVLRRRLQVFWR